MKINRRNFLLAAPLAAGAILQLGRSASGQALMSGSGSAGNDALARLVWDSFVPYMYTDFAFRDASGKTVSLRLSRMTDDLPADVKRVAGCECFTLIFTGPAKSRLADQTFSVEHFALGNFDLYISPGAVSGKQAAYRAVFNRINA